MKCSKKYLIVLLALMSAAIYTKSAFAYEGTPVKVYINNQSSDNLNCKVDSSHSPKEVETENFPANSGDTLFISDYSKKEIDPETVAEFHCFTGDNQNKDGHFVKVKYKYTDSNNYCKVEDDDNFSPNYKLKLKNIESKLVAPPGVGLNKKELKCNVIITDNNQTSQ